MILPTESGAESSNFLAESSRTERMRSAEIRSLSFVVIRGCTGRARDVIAGERGGSGGRTDGEPRGGRTGALPFSGGSTAERDFSAVS